MKKGQKGKRNMDKTKAMSNADLDNLQNKLRTATICDILDDLGYRNQATRGAVHPLDDSYRLLGPRPDDADIRRGADTGAAVCYRN